MARPRKDPSQGSPTKKLPASLSQAISESRAYGIYYSESKAQEIIHYYLEGLSLHKISQQPEMPSYGTLMRWHHENQAFRTMLYDAKKTRALHKEEQISDLGEGDFHKDDVPGARLKFDILRWEAEVSDPTQYGKKTTISGDQSKPISFIISTGVPEPMEHQKVVELTGDGLVKSIASETPDE